MRRLFPSGLWEHRILNMAMLYASKVGAILVGILILPQFNRLLGPHQFGVVAVILSVQGLLLMMDLGMSTLVGRDVAAFGSDGETAAHSWRDSHSVLTGFYLAMAPFAWLLNLASGMPLTGLQLAACLLLFWALTLQNVGQTALLAARRFSAASSIQLVGTLARALATLAALNMLGANLTVFAATQALCAVLQWVATDAFCRRQFVKGGLSGLGMPLRASRALAMLRRGSPLVFFGLAGAAAMQLDKPLISALASATATAPYYLATVLCLMPLSTLAGPVAQFFQPRLTQAIASGDDDAVHRTLTPFTTTLVLITFIPSALLWLLRGPVVGAWLGHAANGILVARYTGILLPGAAVGALGFLPYSILVARQDFHFQAVTSVCMTLLTLTGAAAFAQRGNIEGVCWVYAGYHCLSTTISWLRCIHLDRGGVRHANAAGMRAAALAATVSLPTLAVALGTHFA